MSAEFPARRRRDGTPMATPIPPEDWDRAPWNRYSFQHVREFVPTVTVERGDVHTPLPAAPRSLGALTLECDGLAQTIDTFVAASDTDGFLILFEGAIVTETYGNGMTPSTRHLSQSVAKSVVGCVAGILAHRGVIDLDAPLTEYLPELAATAYREATVQHVMDMTSGVTWDETYTRPDSHCAKLDAAAGWKPRRNPDWPGSTWELILTLTELECAHGASFRYRSIETDVLGFALQRAAGRPLAELVSRELWAPLGAQHEAYFTIDPAGYACACGGFNATLRDYGRFALMLAGHGAIDGRQVVPASFIAATRAGDPTRFGESPRAVLPHGAYHNQFWLERPGGPFMARGVFGQLIYVDPEAAFAAVKLSSWPEFVDPVRTRTALAALHAVRAHLTGRAAR